MLCNILEILRYRNPDVETFKCKCGVLQHASCFDSRPALYISLKHLTSSVLCQPPPNTPPPKKKKPSWIALAYITQLRAHQSVRAVFMFAPRCFSWRSRSKGEAAMERVRRSWANMRKHLHIWDAWQELSSRPTVNTHTRTQRRWSPCTCSTKAEELQPHCQTKCGNTGVHCTGGPRLGHVTGGQGENRKIKASFLRGLCWNTFKEEKKKKQPLPLQKERAVTISLFAHSTDWKNKSCISKNITTCPAIGYNTAITIGWGVQQ